MNQSIASSARSARGATFFLVTAAAAVTASLAAGLSAALAFPVWAMFIGWVSFFTRGPSLRDGAVNATCVVLGLVVGSAAALALANLAPSLGVLALPLVVFVVALVVVSLRAAPVVNNIPCYFLGLIAFFASHLKPSVSAVAVLAAAVALGAMAAWTAHALQHRAASASVA
jgi:hypothetical protein